MPLVLDYYIRVLPIKYNKLITFKSASRVGCMRMYRYTLAILLGSQLLESRALLNKLWL